MWYRLIFGCDQTGHWPRATPQCIWPKNSPTVQEDVQYQLEAGSSHIFPCEEVRRLRPKKLKVYLMVVLPHNNWQVQIILDISFPVYSFQGGKLSHPIQASVNETTKRMAPDALVKEISNVFHRLLKFICSVCTDYICMLSKIELLGGFWRILVELHFKWNSAYMMSNPPGRPILLVVPSVLQMGWVESPAYFWAATETGRDLIYQAIEKKSISPITSSRNKCIQLRNLDGAQRRRQCTEFWYTWMISSAQQSKLRVAHIWVESLKRPCTSFIVYPLPPPWNHRSHWGKRSHIPEETPKGDACWD